MSLWFESPFSTRRYGSQARQPGSLTTPQRADNPINYTIHLVCGIPRLAVVFVRYLSYQIQFLHLPGD
jgi:hypothetical protein